MNERIKMIRKEANLTMEEFGAKVGIKRASVSLIESGRNNPSNSTIKMICKTFRVNELWLRTGEGGPYGKLTKKEALADFFGNVLNEENDDSFKVQLIDFLSRLDEDDWSFLAKLADKLISQREEHEEAKETELYEFKPFA